LFVDVIEEPEGGTFDALIAAGNGPICSSARSTRGSASTRIRINMTRGGADEEVLQ